jgi:FMN phosphatase YigB (HAD superfamily)
MPEPAMEPPFISDVFAAAVPEKFDLSNPEQFPAIHALMNQLAEVTTLGQYRRRPKALLFAPTEWLVTSDPADIERFQPAHCEECRAGNERALEFLRANPGRAVALGNLSYREVW